MEKHYNKLRIKTLEHLLLPIIFFSYVYISYGIVIQGFVSTEIQIYFNINQNIVPLLNIPIFLGTSLGFYIYIYNSKIKYKKFFYSFLIMSIFINLFIIILRNFLYFILARLISAMGYGILLGYLFNYYYFYKLQFNVKSISLEWRNPFGILLASLFSYYFVQILSWKSAFYFLLTGIFVIIGVSFLPNIHNIQNMQNIRFSLFKNLSKEKKFLVIQFMIIYFIIGNNFYILVMNIKYLLVSLLNNHIVSNIYLILFSLSIILGYFISIYLYKNFNLKTLIILLNLLLIFTSFLSLNIFSYNQEIYFISSNMIIQTILWNIFLIYSINYFDTFEIYTVIKLIFFMFFLGGIFSSFFSFLMFKNLYINIFLLIIIFTILFIIMFLILSKNYNRHNHFMKR
ncbi:hypothetical protein SAMN02745164_01556 [Marinitoga hydrogenitolerans DSM 16785]|uniref:Major facilitator superfamily (MFS) profile domain-containing protein n=1 Tax=Marinitoga hydrogenitolerans (strain DSM 16785 / JCM 12826 / AT1271) TaxID=1122195 RepID=A0A1M4XZI9_MARH1|nr:hypothetical protein SAMN02745164_01556 [Marinitoga hydrogenitolerans DSM 16785]